MFASRRSAVTVRNMAGNPNDAPEILVYGEIGFEVSGSAFVRELQSLANEPEVHVRINSPGGNLFEGLVIANAIKAFRGRLVTHIDAMAASAASLIAIAGQEVRMADNAFFMIHEPFTFGIGTADDFRSLADTLDKMGASFITQYMNRSGQNEETVKAWLKAETWFNAAEALEEGFIDELEGITEEEAAFDLSAFHNAPEELKRMAASSSQNKTPTVRSIERALREAGLSRAEARKTASSLRHGELHSPRDADSQDLTEALAALTASMRTSINP
jgi:ATP-dependent Clp protease protease subunit